ncbi:MAG: citrate/2-methylcitrate synthase [Ruthenibacterium lactatiformans]
MHVVFQAANGLPCGVSGKRNLNAACGVRYFRCQDMTVSGLTAKGVEAYLRALLHREAFDRAGLIYGMGHAVYSLSDPRANVFKHFVEMLSVEKGRHEEYALYAAVARLAPKVIGEERKIYKGVSANIDFYSGFVYSMLDLPLELYTPIFAISRIAGWSAHRIEELINAGKIIRPAYKSVRPQVDYVPCTTANNLQNKTGLPGSRCTFSAWNASDII